MQPQVNARRRQMLTATAMCSIGSLLPIAARAADDKILIGYWPIAAGLPFYLAVENGFFKDAGVNVEAVRFASPSQVAEAMVAGRIHGSANGTASAALGLAERTDALALVVSEERGIISVANRGDLIVIDNLQDLHRILEDFLREIAPRTPRQNLFTFLTHNTREKALAVGMSVGTRAQDTVTTTSNGSFRAEQKQEDQAHWAQQRQENQEHRQGGIQ